MAFDHVDEQAVYACTGNPRPQDIQVRCGTKGCWLARARGRPCPSRRHRMPCSTHAAVHHTLPAAVCTVSKCSPCTCTLSLAFQWMLM